MGFYIRKSIKVGPFRYNLSSSGIGVSVGFKGLRVGTGPRGNYIHIGGGGLYYRKSFYAPRMDGRREALPPNPTSANLAPGMVPVASAGAESMVASNSMELLQELNDKQRKMRLAPLAWTGSILILVTMAGYEAPTWAIGLALILLAIAIRLAHQRDALVKSTVLFYQLDGAPERAYQDLLEAFEAVARIDGKWMVIAQGLTGDLKRNAGATYNVSRKPIYAQLADPPMVKSNIAVPSLKLGEDTLYFFPDRILIFGPRGVGAIAYEDISFRIGATRFIEHGSVPRDAEQVDTTWLYVNKGGGPDRRFKNNRRLPVMRYEEIQITSGSGLNKFLQLSRVGLAAGFANALNRLQKVLG